MFCHGDLWSLKESLHHRVEVLSGIFSFLVFLRLFLGIGQSAKLQFSKPQTAYPQVPSPPTKMSTIQTLSRSLRRNWHHRQLMPNISVSAATIKRHCGRCCLILERSLLL
jgi:hypothetical protein